MMALFILQSQAHQGVLLLKYGLEPGKEGSIPDWGNSSVFLEKISNSHGICGPFLGIKQPKHKTVLLI
jgi:hypothetical protein